MIRSTAEACQRLEEQGQLLRIKEELDPDLVMAQVALLAQAAGAPALLFEKVKGSPFKAAANLFGTAKRAKILLDGFDRTARLLSLKKDPSRAFKMPLDCLRAGWQLLPQKIAAEKAPVLLGNTTLSKLPAPRCWPLDGGPFVTLPQVYTEDPAAPGWKKSNLGMYRVQLGGNDYVPERECGLHYQIHRGIGVHHEAHRRLNKPFRVAIFVGGPPAMSFSAVMPLPEGMPEIAFAGVLGAGRIRLSRWRDWTVAADADFCIVGTIDPDRLKPEGPFGDHLGYYSLTHDFPLLKVEAVFHRPDAIWPFTVVGRPPQEDSVFGELIHDLAGPILPTEIPGLVEAHAVDAAGVHPLLLAKARERYTPYAEVDRPQEILTVAHALLGKGQLSLAKVILIARDQQDCPSTHDEGAFLDFILSRADFRRDLHFTTQTTADTLDYSCGGIVNQGSKLVIAACGPARRQPGTEMPGLVLPVGFRDPVLARPGILCLKAPKFTSSAAASAEVRALESCNPSLDLMKWPLIVLCDEPAFCAKNLHILLWTVFTRLDPARDVHGFGEEIIDKHWGCAGPLVFDARLKPWNAPELVADPASVATAREILKRHGVICHG